MPITDYKALLVKYIRHVGDCEGVSFLRDGIDCDAGFALDAQPYRRGGLQKTKGC